MSLTNRDLWIDPSETEREGTRFFGHLLLFSVIVIVIAGLVWSHYAVLDEITRGEGKVIPSSQTQVIQSVKGGKIKALNVREGDIVEADQVLAVLDNTDLSTNEAELKQRKWTAAAALARLQAEIAGKKEPEEVVFPADLMAEAPEVAETERSVFVIRQQQVQSQRTTLEQQVETKQQELRQIDTKVSTTTRVSTLPSSRSTS